MSPTVVAIMVLSGLCLLPSCFPLYYVVVPVPKNWTAAQSYCRSTSMDLAAVQTEQDLAELNQLLSSEPQIWIGLFPDIKAWKWSLDNQGYYGAGQAAFRRWEVGEPNGGYTFYKIGVAMLKSGNWVDAACSLTFTFICYDAGAQATSSGFVFVNQSVTWTEAQSYCRLHHTDLVSVRNQAENDQLVAMTQQGYTWIGLYRDSWEWSDGTSLSVASWDGGAPTGTYTDSCVLSSSGKWTNADCASKQKFACNVGTRKQVVVQLELERSNSSVDMQELTGSILQKLIQRLQDQRLTDVRLRWVERPDGTLRKRPQTEEQTCGGEAAGYRT